MAPRYTTAMEGGNAIFACQYMDVRVRAMYGAIAESKKWPYFLYIYAPCHPWHRAIPYFLYIYAPCHPWHRAIPYFLYITQNALVGGRFSKYLSQISRRFLHHVIHDVEFYLHSFLASHHETQQA
jgi:hypothetical protein